MKEKLNHTHEYEVDRKIIQTHKTQKIFHESTYSYGRFALMTNHKNEDEKTYKNPPGDYEI